jgi:hypothetical protein
MKFTKGFIEEPFALSKDTERISQLTQTDEKLRREASYASELRKKRIDEVLVPILSQNP